jgi:hypothetical protein
MGEWTQGTVIHDKGEARPTHMGQRADREPRGTGMSDPGMPAGQPRRRPDNDASSATPGEPANRPRPDEIRSGPDRRRDGGHAAGRRHGAERQSRSEEQPTLNEVDSVEVMRPPEGRRPDRCAVVYEGSGRYGEFQVVTAQTDGSRSTVARSPAFRAPRFGRPRRRGPAGVAYELLVSRLEACGWRPVDLNGPWHELGFLRFHDPVLRAGRALVTVVREAGQARFVAEELDAYGNPTPLMVSDPFGAPRLLRVRPSSQARAALNELVERMESEGWNVGAPVGKEPYALSFWRSTATKRRPRAPKSGL